MCDALVACDCDIHVVLFSCKEIRQNCVEAFDAPTNGTAFNPASKKSIMQSKSLIIHNYYKLLCPKAISFNPQTRQKYQEENSTIIYRRNLQILSQYKTV